MFDFLESEGYIRLKAYACTSSKELYEVYKMWCEENSMNAIKARGFSDELIANQRRYNLESTNNIVNRPGGESGALWASKPLCSPTSPPMAGGHDPHKGEYGRFAAYVRTRQSPSLRTHVRSD